MNDAEPGRAKQVIAKLIRVHNLLFLLIVVNGLASYPIVKISGIFNNPPAGMIWLNVACIALPIVSLILTALATNRMIRSHVRRRGEIESNADDSAACFQRAKILSMVLMTVSGLFAGTCVIFAHRVREAILVVVPVLLMLLTRPSNMSLDNFVTLVEMEREDQFGARPDLDANAVEEPAEASGVADG